MYIYNYIAKSVHCRKKFMCVFYIYTVIQVLRLLQKFLDSDVIRDVRGKITKFDAEGSTLYCFVTEPGPLNFVEDMDTSGCHSSPSRPRSPLGKHTRPKGKLASKELSEDTLFTNEYAFMSSGNDSMSESYAMETSSVCSRDETGAVGVQMGSESDSGSPVKKCRSNGLFASKVDFRREECATDCDNSIEISKSSSSLHLVQLTPAQVAGVWKDLTLNHLLQLVELETLEGVLAYDAVDGKHIASNVGTLVSRNRPFASLAAVAAASPTAITASCTNGSTSSLPSAISGCGNGRTTNGASGGGGGGVGSSHPHWLNRRFGTRLSRVQPSQRTPPSLAPPAANVLSRSRSARKSSNNSSSASSALTLHHKLRYSIKHRSSGDMYGCPSSSSAAASVISTSRSSNCLSEGREGADGLGGRVRGESHTHTINQSIPTCGTVCPQCGARGRECQCEINLIHAPF